MAGSLLTPDYSPVSQAISELIETGAPAKHIVDPFLLAFHGMVVPFALGLGARLGTRAGRLGAALLTFAGLAGLAITLFFPCDPGCVPVTMRGTVHIFVAIPMGFSVLFAILLFSFAFPAQKGATQEHAAWLALYARASSGAGLVLAVVTVALAESAVVGVLERLLTLSYLQWYAVMGVWLMRRPRRAAQ